MMRTVGGLRRSLLSLAVALPLLLLAIYTAGAQATTGEHVGGKVVDAVQGAPLPHATVTLEDNRTNAVAGTVFSGDDGSFRFDSIPPGKYRLTATRMGYLSAAYLQHGQFSSAIVTGAGLATGALELRLMPASSISGHIRDETGDPVQRATVSLYREAPEATTERVRRFRTAITNDEGEFAFDHLPKGRFYLSATAMPWYAVHPMPDNPNARWMYRTSVDPALDVAYPRVFYPNALSSDGASPIELKGGEQAVADMQMTPQHALSVTVQRPPNGGAGVLANVQLMQSVFGNVEPVMTQMSFMNGTREIVGVAPGQYLVQEFVPGQGMPGPSVPVDLTSGPVSMEAPPAAPAATITVTVHAAPGRTLPAKVRLNLRTQDSNRSAVTMVGAKGTGEFARVPPGDYHLTAFSENRVVNIAAVTVAGHPVADRHIHVAGDGPVAVEATLGGVPVKVEGFARRESKPDAGAMVVLVPAGADTGAELFRRDESDLDGSFVLNNVAPGNYLLLAIDDGWEMRWTDAPTLMPYLLHALPVAIPENGSGTIRLQDVVTAQPR